MLVVRPFHHFEETGEALSGMLDGTIEGTRGGGTELVEIITPQSNM